MSYSNLNYALDATAKDNMKKALDDFEVEAAKFWVNLTTGERSTLSKMGDDGYSYVTKAIDYSKLFPAFVPGDMDKDSGPKDLTFYNDLRPYFIRLIAFARAIENTMMAAGVEAKDFADGFYDAVQRASGRSNPQAQPIFDDLKPFYERASTETPPASPLTA